MARKIRITETFCIEPEGLVTWEGYSSLRQCWDSFTFVTKNQKLKTKMIQIDKLDLPEDSNGIYDLRCDHTKNVMQIILYVSNQKRECWITTGPKGVRKAIHSIVVAMRKQDIFVRGLYLAGYGPHPFMQNFILADNAVDATALACKYFHPLHVEGYNQAPGLVLLNIGYGIENNPIIDAWIH